MGALLGPLCIARCFRRLHLRLLGRAFTPRRDSFPYWRGLSQCWRFATNLCVLRKQLRLEDPYPHDSIWHRVGTVNSTGYLHFKIDDVVQVISIDALDEPLGAVWSAKITV